MSGHPLQPFSLSEFIAALIVLAITVGVGLVAYFLYKAHNIGPSIAVGGLGIIFLSGVFDPINALWLLIPFTFHPLVKKPYSLEQRILRRSGFVIVIIGILYVCGGNVWFIKTWHAFHTHVKPP